MRCFEVRLHERLGFLAVRDGDLVSGGHLLRRDGDSPPVDKDVAVPDHLARAAARRGESDTGDDIVEPPLEGEEQVLARVAARALRPLEGKAELAFEHAVVALELLLLAELEPVGRDLAAAPGAHAGGEVAPFERAPRGVAARALEKKLGALAPAKPAFRSGVASHSFSPVFLRLRPGVVSWAGIRYAAAGSRLRWR